MTTIQIRDVSLFVKVIGQGYPLLVMHGGHGADHSTMLPLQAARCFFNGQLTPREYLPTIWNWSFINRSQLTEQVKPNEGE